MDKSWMHVDRRSVAYKLGVENFFKFALENAKDPNKISCPCIKCGNMDDFPISVIKTHLYYNGIDESYKFWKWHGEVADTSSVDSTSLDSSDPTESESVEGNVRADWNVEMDGLNDDDEEFSSECNEFRSLLMMQINPYTLVVKDSQS
ncbi:hypothetical protein M0R45_000606 [Rubus argutus]|uniref:Transposase-associated domain-containing protein n=1 Tax=Rubus argutus TaxID=59490 RepID=A0AAW1VNS2_RUBAR